MADESPAYTMPDLPDNQRWLVQQQFFFLVVKLQERRWWGWRTIADSTDVVSGGAVAVARCVEMIQRREYYALLRAEHEASLARRRNEIPFDVHD